MVVVVGVGNGPAGVPQLHLQGGINDGVRREDGDQKAGCAKQRR